MVEASASSRSAEHPSFGTPQKVGTREEQFSECRPQTLEGSLLADKTVPLGNEHSHFEADGFAAPVSPQLAP